MEGCEILGGVFCGAEVDEALLRAHQVHCVVIRLDSQRPGPGPELGPLQHLHVDVLQLLPCSSPVQDHLIAACQACLHQGPMGHTTILGNLTNNDSTRTDQKKCSLTGEKIEVVVKIIVYPPDLPAGLHVLPPGGVRLVHGRDVERPDEAALEVVHCHVAVIQPGHEHVGVLGVEVEAHDPGRGLTHVLGVGGVLEGEHADQAPVVLAVDII